MSSAEHYLDVNRALWNNKTQYHLQSDFYEVEAFKKGKSSLNSIELEQLGDVRNKTLLHLQCHFGQDTLSWARMGASVTGIDFSDEAIKAARHLAQELNIEADFIQSNVYDVKLARQFDIIFTSYGVIGWLPDLEKWAQVIANHLKPGGEFHLIEFHPVVWMFDNDFQYIQYSYFNREDIIEEVHGSYADRSAPIVGQSVSWNHSLDEVLGALLRQGLRIEHFAEYDYSPYNCFVNTVQIAENQWQIKGLEGKIPMVYALKARKY
ncbi:MAG: class I SAM-dependent methyltransferase [Saprospiraceae bacterium]